MDNLHADPLVEIGKLSHNTHTLMICTPIFWSKLVSFYTSLTHTHTLSHTYTHMDDLHADLLVKVGKLSHHTHLDNLHADLLVKIGKLLLNSL